MCSLRAGGGAKRRGAASPGRSRNGGLRGRGRGPRGAGAASPPDADPASGVKRERNGARSYNEGHTRPPGREGEEPEGRKERSDCQGLDSLILPIHPWMEKQVP